MLEKYVLMFMLSVLAFFCGTLSAKLFTQLKSKIRLGKNEAIKFEIYLEYLIGIAFFGSIAAGLITWYPIFWKISGVTILLLIFSPLTSLIWELVFPKKK